MILTYKIKHNRDFCEELIKARKIAEFAIANRNKLSSKYVKSIGLNSSIASCILRKYGRNWKIKSVKSVKLTVPGQKIWHNGDIVYISSLKLTIPFSKLYDKINQVEIDDVYVYISVTIKEPKRYIPEKSIGVDLNTTGHCAVIAIGETGKVYKLGSEAQHIHTKYMNIRKFLQKKGLYKTVKKIKNRESNIVRDMDHKISRFIIDLAVKEKGEIHLEKLHKIRNDGVNRKFRYSLNSWSFYQLAKFIEYKALLAGVPVIYVDPAYTSVICSKCGLIGERKGKTFKCLNGHVEHADVNAAFNIALPSLNMFQLQAERDACKRSTDTRQMATLVV